MLADEIIAASGGDADKLYMGSVTELGMAIRSAKRFDLSPGVIVTAHTVNKSSIAAQNRAMPLSRLPFDYVWMEWPGSDPVYEAFQEANFTDTVKPPHRVGALIVTDESRQKGSMTFAWSHREHGINACPLGVHFDWRREGSEVFDVVRNLHFTSGGTQAELEQMIVDEDRGFPQMKGTSKSEQLAHRFRYGTYVSPFFDRWAHTTAAHQGGLPGPGTPEWAQWMGDIRGESGVVRSAIMMLNTKNLTLREDVSISPKLNGSRAKVGKRPLLDYTKIQIKLSHGLQERAGSTGKRDASRLHAVRGHFKVKSSGLYWWSDHFRGDVSRGIVAGSYNVDL